MYSWRDEPSSCSDSEMDVDEACPKCGHVGEQTVYGSRRSRTYTGTAECYECGHEWEIEFDYDPY